METVLIVIGFALSGAILCHAAIGAWRLFRNGPPMACTEPDRDPNGGEGTA